LPIAAKGRRDKAMRRMDISIKGSGFTCDDIHPSWLREDITRFFTRFYQAAPQS